MDAFGNELNRLLVDTYRIAGKIEQIMLQDLSDGKLSLACCMIAEKIQEEEEREHSIASEKVGDHSVTYREGFACETASEIIALAEMYLSGTGLLYRGIPVVCSA